MLIPSESVDVELNRRMKLSEFVKRSWHVLESKCPLVWSWHMDAICDHVQALLDGWASATQTGALPPAQNLVINVPPGSSKSRIVSVCAPAWRWVRRPDCRIIAISGNPRVSTRDSVYCRQLIASDWYQQTFQPKWKMRDDQDTKTLFANTIGGFRSSFGAGSRLTGDRADVALFDDLLDARDAHNKSKRNSVNEWYDQAAANRVNDAERSVRIGIMQRLHEEDWTAHVLSDGAEWQHLCIPQEYDPGLVTQTWIGWTDPRREPSELMCSERFGPARIVAERRRLGSVGYAAQHQQRPVPAEGAMIQRSWWRRYSALPRLDYTVAGWDLGNSEVPGENSSYTVGLLLGVAWPNFYVLDVSRARLSPLGAENAIRDCDAKWSAKYGRPRATLIESKAAGPAVTERVRKVFPAVEAFRPEGKKEERLAAVAPMIEAGNVFLPVDAAFVSDFIDEVCAFPKSANNDQVDTLSMTLIWATSNNAGYKTVQMPRVGRKSPVID